MNRKITGGSLTRLLQSSRAAGGAAAFISFALPAVTAYLVSAGCEANVWFSAVLAVAVGVMGFCCLRVWLDGGAYDDPRSNAYVMLAGVLAFIGMVLTYITLNIYPFGDHTVLIIDMHHQYVSFITSLRDRLSSLGSLVYSDGIGLGGGYLPLFAYYLASPFNILTLLFPKDCITEAIALITILKVTSGAVCFSIFARYMFRRNDFFIVIGGLAYSMMAFFICHSWNIMWLDPLVLLPLVVLGLEKLLRTGKPLLYCVSLAAVMLTNYYIGYMICIFLVFYYFAHVIANGAPECRCGRAGRFWRFCYGSLLGGGLSAVTIVPAYLYLQTTSGADDAFARKLGSNFSLFSIFQRSLFSAYPSMRGDNLPNIYCSVLAVLLLLVFVLCRGISLRKRVAWSMLAGVVAVAMSVNWLNFAWHGFHFPNDLPYRFSFLLSFALLYIAMLLLDNVDKVRPREVVTALAIFTLLLAAEQEIGDGEATFIMIYISLAFAAVYAVITALCAAGRMRQTLCWALLALFLFTEVTANASLLMQQLDSNEYFTERESFVFDYDVNSTAFEAIEQLKQADGPDGMMYREELLPRKTCNDPSLYGYSGMTVFASSNRESVTDTMGSLGYACNGVNSYLYKNFVPVSDSLLGLKYVVLSKQMKGHEQLDFVEKVEDKEENRRYIHENNAALSKAYLVSSDIIFWDYDAGNPFDVQNSLVSTASRVEDVYTNIPLFTVDGDYLLNEYVENYIDSPEGTVNIDLPTGEEDEHTVSSDHVTTSGYNTTASISGTYFTISLMNEDMQGNAAFTTRIGDGGQYYIYVDCRAAETAMVSYRQAGSEDSTEISSATNEPNIIDLGYLGEGAELTVSLTTEISCGGNIFLARLNGERFEEAVETLRAGELQVTDYKEGAISGRVNAEQGCMMFTSLPYDSGWTVRVDGRKVGTFALGDAFLCFAVPEGEHTITLVYFPTGFVVGMVITLLSLLVLLVLTVPRLRAEADRLCAQAAERVRAARAREAAKRREAGIEQAEVAVEQLRADMEREEVEGFETDLQNDFADSEENDELI